MVYSGHRSKAVNGSGVGPVRFTAYGRRQIDVDIRNRHREAFGVGDGDAAEAGGFIR